MTAIPTHSSAGSNGAFFSGDLAILDFVDSLDYSLISTIDQAIGDSLEIAEDKFIEELSSSRKWAGLVDSAGVAINEGQLVLTVESEQAVNLEYGIGRTPPDPALRKSVPKVAKAFEKSVNQKVNGGNRA